MLHRIAELNPYVQVSSSTAPFDETTDLSFLGKYQVCIKCYWYIPEKLYAVTSITQYIEEQNRKHEVKIIVIKYSV